ncbi:MAG: glycosyltransferase [Halopseudomonas sp.]
MAQVSPSVAYIVEEQPNPSTDFFVEPALATAGCDSATRIVRCRFTELPKVEALNGAVVIFVRYVPKPWKQLVESARDQISQIIFFMDDDLLDLGASKGMPWRYRIKLARLATLRKRWLRTLSAKLWVSTPFLHNKYQDWNPSLVSPKPLSRTDSTIRLFYHGSASHNDEIRWLYPVIKTVLLNDERLSFEIIGGKEVNQMFRELPRTTVVHPMKWLAYKAFLSQPGRMIGLAPLLDIPFNQARSYTKFFDITHAGAIGIYARNPIFAEVVVDGVNGLLVEMDQQQWIEAIQTLVANKKGRRTMCENAASTMQSLAVSKPAD